MYVDPYWFGFGVGALATIVFEIILLVGIGLHFSREKGEKK